MPRHQLRRPPRAHWLLLLLALATLMSALIFQGYTRHLVGRASTRPLTGGAPAPAAVAHGGPVLKAGQGGQLASTRPPADTVALTFDDGPDPTWTPRILAVLRRHHAHATFFMVGSRVNEHPGLVAAVVREGTEVG